MDNKQYKQRIKTGPFGYAYHKIILDEAGNPIDYEILDVNPAFEKLTGLEAADIINRPITEVLPGIRKGEFDWITFYGEIALNGGEKEFDKYSEPLKRWYKVQAYSTEKNYFTTTFIDITERKKAENALEKRLVSLTQPLEDTEVAFEDLFSLDEIQAIQDEFSNATGVASIITHIDGTPITKPSNFTRLCNDIIRKTGIGRHNCYISDSVIGACHPTGPIVQPCLSGGLWDAGASISVGGRHVANWLIGQVRSETQKEDEMRAYAKKIGADEQTFMEAFYDVPSMQPEKFTQIARLLFTFANQLSKLAHQNVQQARFITERSRVEAEKQKMLEASQRNQRLESLGILAGGIAHDFNNLMGGIFGYLELAKKKSMDDTVTQWLSKAVNTIDRARGLTQQLLTFSKGGDPIQEIASLTPLIHETVNFSLSGSNVSCRFNIAKNLWSCNIDKNQIGQAIGNIIINAHQAMPIGGAIEVFARNIILEEKELPPLGKGNYVKISIKDSGVGIPQKILPRIFDPFFTTKLKGHGIGLATCYSIINRHKGLIEVESEPEKGSVFHIYLPASAEIGAENAVTVIRHKGSGTILVMDDEEVIREIIKTQLEELGYSVICATDGKEAIDFYMQETKAGRSFTGMIFDLTVPGGMGGKEAVSKIRKYNTGMPVFVASGYAEDPVMKNPGEYGFTASISKPFLESELKEMLSKHMKNEDHS